MNSLARFKQSNIEMSTSARAALKSDPAALVENTIFQNEGKK
jgi:hypothetical protein